MFKDDQVYTKQTFSKQVASNKKFSTIEFADCTFENCNFMESIFYKCSFVNCVFTGCDLSILKVTNSKFVQVRFQQTKAIGIDWTVAGGLQSKMPISINFTNSVINYSSFFGMNLPRMELVACTAHEVDFSETNLTDANCQETDFQDSKFLHTNLTGANFVHARNYTINPTSAVVKKATFSLPEAIALLRGFDVVIE